MIRDTGGGGGGGDGGRCSGFGGIATKSAGSVTPTFASAAAICSGDGNGGIGVGASRDSTSPSRPSAFAIVIFLSG